MAETVPKVPIDSPPAKSSGTIASWWHKFHFSGRVIMCSVLFGFGLILIGSIVFAINMNDDSPNPLDGDHPDEIPTKAPSNVVGPVVMGIGSFIVIVGIVMCLFETQVCRKKTGDSSPLLSGGRKDAESAGMPSTSHGSSHRHAIRKPGASPNRSKGRHAKPHSKDRNQQQKTPSPQSPPVTIESSKQFMTSSEDTFLTPPNTLNEHPAQTHGNPRNAENQTSLMKSISSSGPSWNQSTEFQTPSTSFRDTSVYLDNSIEVGEYQDQGISNTSVLRKLNSNDGFQTPATLEDEKVQKMAGQLQNHKDEISNAQSSSNVSLHLTNSKNDELADESTSQISGKDHENMKTGSIHKKVEKDNQESGNIENATDLTQKKSLNIQEDEQFVEGSETSELINSHGIMQQDMSSSEEYSLIVSNEDTVIPEILVVDEKHHIIVEENKIEKTESKEEMCKDALEINSDEQHLSHNSEEITSKNESEENGHQNVLESSVSSDETVVSQGSVLGIPANVDVTEECNSESDKTNETLSPNIAESENITSSIQNDDTDTHLSQSSMIVNENPSEPAEFESKDISVDKNADKESKDFS